MATNIVLKRSATQDAVPGTSDLELGELALNTYDGKLYMKKTVGGSSSIVNLSGGTAASSSAFSHTTFKYTASGSTTTFSGTDDDSKTLSYTAGQLQVFLNGILLDVSDYTASNGTSVVLDSATSSGSILLATSFTGTNPFDYFKYVATSSQTTFTGNDANSESLIYTVGNIQVYLNGVLLDASDYTATSGTTVVLGSGATSGDILTIWEFNEAAPGDLASDTSPQLTGDLDVNGNDIVSTSNAHINVIPHGTGNVTLQTDTLQLGSSAENVIVTTNSTGDLTLNTNSGTNSGSIVIADGANNNITLTPNGSGNVVLDNHTWPAADGSANQVLQTNGSGVLSFTTISSSAITDTDNDTKIQVEEGSDDDTIRFDISGTEQIVLVDGVLKPTTDNDIDLGTSSLEFKDAFFDGTVTSDAFAGPLTGDVTGDLTGTADLATSVTVSANNSTDETVYPLFVDGATGTQGAESDTGLTYNPSSGTLTSSIFVGALTGTASLSTLAATATALATARTIGGTSFDGTANIAVATATEATNVTVSANNSTDETVYPVFVDGATSTQGIESDTGLTYNPSSGTLTSTILVGALTGNVTGNVSGSAGSATGNAATSTLSTNVTASANNSTDETVYPTFVDGATGSQGIETDTGLTYNPSSGIVTATQFTGAVVGNVTGNVTGNTSGSSGSTTGNAATATALANARTIGGTSFDGTANIAVATATEGTNVTVSANNSTDETVYPTFVDGATGTQGIETDTGLTYNPSSGIITATQFTGAVVGNVTGNAATATALATARTIGGTSFDGTGNIAVATATEGTNVTVSANNSTDETVYPTFVDGATGTQGIETDTGLTYNPSTGMLTATGLTGTLTGNVTGNVTGNTSGTAATVTTAAQTNITSLGTLTTLTVDNVLINGTTIGHTGDTDLMTLTSGNLTVAGDVYIGDSNKELRFYEGSNYVGFEAPALSANQIWVLPSADGSANQTLKTDGSGTLSWATAASAVSNLTDVTLSSVSNKDILVYNGSAWINTPTASNPSVDTMTGDGSDTTLTLTKTPLHENATSVYIDGVYQSKDNYSVSGTTLTFSTAPPNGTAVEVMTGNNGTVATILNVLNKAGSNIACAILNAAFTVVPKTGSNISVGVT